MFRRPLACCKNPEFAKDRETSSFDSQDPTPRPSSDLPSRSSFRKLPCHFRQQGDKRRSKREQRSTVGRQPKRRTHKEAKRVDALVRSTAVGYRVGGDSPFRSLKHDAPSLRHGLFGQEVSVDSETVADFDAKRCTQLRNSPGYREMIRSDKKRTTFCDPLAKYADLLFRERRWDWTAPRTERFSRGHRRNDERNLDVYECLAIERLR